VAEKIEVSCAKAAIGRGMEDETNRPGSNIETFALKSTSSGDIPDKYGSKPNGEWGPQVCERACLDNTKCKAWSLEWAGLPPLNTNKVMRQDSICYLKGAAPPAISHPRFVSGVVVGRSAKAKLPDPPISTSQDVHPGMENNVDRPGSDFLRDEIVPRRDNPARCQQACLASDKCRAWTYVRPGVQGTNGVCYLKHAAPPPVSSSCCISGVKPSKSGADAMRERGPLAPPRAPGDVTQPPGDIAGSVPGAGPSGAAPYGKIGDKYAALGGAGGALGPPTGEERDAPHGGRCQTFRHGAICWHPAVGEAFALWGVIHDKWMQLGQIEFGYPITDERPTSDGRGRYNHFRGMQYPGTPEASIFWTPQTGAHAIYGAIRDAWAQQGWERGPLGYPTSDEHQDGKYRRVNFERGYIRWAPDTGIEIGR